MIIDPNPFLSHFDILGNELAIQQIPITEIVSKYGTPSYIYDGNIILRRLKFVKESFPGFKILYSIKANPNLAISKLLAHNGCDAEVSSGGELRLAILAGFNPKNIIFVGPAKTDEEIEYAITSDIGTFAIESHNELNRIERICSRLSKSINILVRINIEIDLGNSSPEKMVGGASKFGIDEESVFELKKYKLQYANLIGIHVYSASQILDSHTLVLIFQKIFSVARKISSELGFTLKTIDMGGGFGIPYNKKESDLDLSSLGNQTLLAAVEQGIVPSKTNLIFELGRFLVATSGIFVTKIIDIKTSRKRTYVLTDGGVNCFARPLIMKMNHPTFVANKITKPTTMKCVVGGPLCTPFDVIANDIFLPETEIGDILCIFNAGAYGFSMSILHFLSHPLPAEILIFDKKMYLIRRRGTFDDIFGEQKDIQL